MTRVVRREPVDYSPEQVQKRLLVAIYSAEPVDLIPRRHLHLEFCSLQQRNFLVQERYSLPLYEVGFLPPMENFPGESAEQDAARVHHLLEDHIRSFPEQYYWVHRRFKGRPPEYPDPYKK